MYISQKTEAPEIRCLNLICTWAANLSFSHFFWLYNLKKIGIGSYSFITFWEERMIGCNELPPISWCKISLASFLRMRGLRHSFHCDLQVFSLPLSFVKGSGIRKIRDFFFFFFFGCLFIEGLIPNFPSLKSVGGSTETVRYGGAGKCYPELQMILFMVSSDESWACHQDTGLKYRIHQRETFLINKMKWGLPWWSVAKTPHSQCRGPEFNPWSGN